MLNQSQKEKLIEDIKHLDFSPVLFRIYQYYFSLSEEIGESIFNKDWDYLIIIDACRHDLFEEVEGKSDFMISLGSCTDEWFNKNFSGDHDLVYISSNPVVSSYRQDKMKNGSVSFYHYEPVWDYGWNEAERTILPEDTTEKAIELAEKYPDKPMIVHYVPPHHPFIGCDVSGNGLNIEYMVEDGNRKEDVWRKLRLGKVTREEVWKAYRKNLEIVMKQVKRLTSELEGKVVLTSDHGNMVGEKGIYAHHEGLKFKQLRKVPYKVLR